MAILMEASSYVKTFKCPYCSFRGDRAKLITHIDTKHEDMIPKEYTATRIVFNLINKKEKGYCTECGDETAWNEDKARYERLCNKPTCAASYKRKIEARIKNIHGKTSKELLGDAKHQEKMLAGRRISGTYKFSDGETRSYTGNNERKALEAFDKFYKCKSTDILSPGPVVQYDFEGKKHMWITDIYYSPYNLVIECKDGGANPNNRPMESYRAKQIAKEKAIVKDGKYNYLRLTDNNFQQLFLIMAELKMQLVENNKDERVVHINESMMGDVANMMPMGNKNNVYIVNYLAPNTFSPEQAVTRDFKLSSLFVQNDYGIIEKKDSSFLEDCSYEIFVTESIDGYNKVKKAYLSGKVKDINYVYEAITGHKRLTTDQIYTESCLKEVNSYHDFMNNIQSITEATLKHSEDTFTEVSLEDDYQICMDRNGYFLRNRKTEYRTESKIENKFSETEILIIKGGVL